MDKRVSLVITSIAGDDNKILNLYAAECPKQGVPFIMIGDSKSPASFNLEGCDYYNLEKQTTLPFKLAPITPQKHYSRKNLGYLVAAAGGAEVIIETDDDNIALPEFWKERERSQPAHIIRDKEWVNVYGYFSKAKIWPRGFALERLQDALPELGLVEGNNIYPVQQGLANENPDVDALYRLILPLPLDFDEHTSVALGKGSWCPFNSQNTTWFREAYLLMYLPSYCSFRMTDIWRSFVTQRICWENGWGLLFHNATVYQERNDHNLMKDFEDEISGYLNNDRIVKALAATELKEGSENIAANLVTCYQVLVDLGLVDIKEMQLLDAWLTDMGRILAQQQ